MMSKQNINEESANFTSTTSLTPEPKRRAGEIFYKFGTNGKLKKVEKLLRIILEANCFCQEEEENEYREDNYEDEQSRTDSEVSDVTGERESCTAESMESSSNTSSEHTHDSSFQ